MYAIIAGGGKVGFFLARELIEQGHEVLIIENNPERAEFIANELGNVVLRGNADEASTLAEAGAERADVVVAGDGQDDVGPLGAGVGQGAGLVGVAAQDDVAELVGDELGALADVLDDQDLVALLDQLAGQEEADLAAASDDRVHQASKASILHSHRVPWLAGQLFEELAGADDRRADRPQAERRERV